MMLVTANGQIIRNSYLSVVANYSTDSSDFFI